MEERKNTCPVCFTKMRAQNDGLVCPECGYKYCDHAHRQDIYDTSHTHAPQYTTYQTTRANNPLPNPVPTRTGNMQPQQNRDMPGRSTAKIVRIIVTIFIVYIFISIFGSFLTSILAYL